MIGDVVKIGKSRYMEINDCGTLHKCPKFHFSHWRHFIVLIKRACGKTYSENELKKAMGWI